MKKLKAYEIRQMWLDFFKSKGHEVIPSASLLPKDDPTLLWINAGVAPLKKYFDGREKPQNPRLCNAQKSIRTNDIDNVGKTARHHTFFEMLGNFSIGDYFREEVLTWAAELLFSEEWFGFDKDLIYITYYTKDLDTLNKWVSLGVDESHMIPLDDNFWEIGEGPCGPDTEIFFDRGEKYDPKHLGIKMLKWQTKNTSIRMVGEKEVKDTVTYIILIPLIIGAVALLLIAIIVFIIRKITNKYFLSK